MGTAEPTEAPFDPSGCPSDIPVSWVNQASKTLYKGKGERFMLLNIIDRKTDFAIRETDYTGYGVLARRTMVTNSLKPWLPVTSKSTFLILRICTTLLVMFSNVMTVANHMLLSAGQQPVWMAVMMVPPRKIKCTLCSAVLTQSSSATRTLMNALDKPLMV